MSSSSSDNSLTPCKLMNRYSAMKRPYRRSRHQLEFCKRSQTTSRGHDQSGMGGATSRNATFHWCLDQAGAGPVSAARRKTQFRTCVCANCRACSTSAEIECPACTGRRDPPREERTDERSQRAEPDQNRVGGPGFLDGKKTGRGAYLRCCQPLGRHHADVSTPHSNREGSRLLHTQEFPRRK